MLEEQQGHERSGRSLTHLQHRREEVTRFIVRSIPTFRIGRCAVVFVLCAICYMLAKEIRRPRRFTTHPIEVGSAIGCSRALNNQNIQPRNTTTANFTPPTCW